MWDPQTAQLLRALPVGKDQVTSISGDHSRLVICGPLFQAQIWSLETGELQRRLSWPVSEQPIRASMSRNGGHIVCACRDNEMRVWDPDQGQLCTVIKRQQHGGETAPQSLCLSRDGMRAFVATPSRTDVTIRVWDTQTGCLVGVLELPDGYTRVSMSTVFTGRTLVVGLNDGIRVWNVKTGEVQRKLDTKSDAVTLSARATFIASGEVGRQVQLWDMRTGKVIRDMAEGHTFTDSLRVTPDEKLIAAVTSARNVSVWEASSGRRLQCLPHPDVVTSMITATRNYQPLILSASRRVVHIWHAETGELLRKCATARAEVVSTLSFCIAPHLGGDSVPSCFIVAGSTGESTLQAWVYETGETLLTLQPPPAARGKYLQVCSSEDGTRICSVDSSSSSSSSSSQTTTTLCIFEMLLSNFITPTDILTFSHESGLPAGGPLLLEALVKHPTLLLAEARLPEGRRSGAVPGATVNVLMQLIRDHREREGDDADDWTWLLDLLEAAPQVRHSRQKPLSPYP